jgi:N-acetylneuraminate epimerase
MMLMTGALSAQEKIKDVEWRQVATLQERDGKPSLGYAGAINGVSNGVLLVAGGANFPGKMPWAGGSKYYSGDVHVLERSGDTYNWIKPIRARLPAPVAYCGSTSTSLGVVYAGGENADGLSRSAYLLSWNKDSRGVEVKQLPDLPAALTNIGLAHLGNVVYAAGGDGLNESTNSMLSLNLEKAGATWEPLPNLPQALANASVVAQEGYIYVVGGRSKSPTGISILHNSTYRYDPVKQVWSTCARIPGGNISAAPGVTIGKDLILILGGDNGQVFHRIETYISEIAKTADPEEKAKLLEKKNALSIHHTGFDRGMLLYNVRTDRWTKLGDLPFAAQVTTTATLWEGNLVLSNGEIRPGIRTPNIMIGQLKQEKR